MVYEAERAERERIEVARGRREPRHRSQVPTTLNDGDVGALNEVRRTVWRNGVQGLLVGTVVLHTQRPAASPTRAGQRWGPV